MLFVHPTFFSGPAEPQICCRPHHLPTALCPLSCLLHYPPGFLYCPLAAGALLYTEFSGFHGLVAALLVAVKQTMPHSEAKVLGVVKLRIKVGRYGLRLLT